MNTKELMRVIITTRTMQLYYHNCHNLISGKSFFSDHSFLGDSYARLESDYDRLVEYYIALFGKKAFETKILIKAISDELLKYEVEEMCCCDMMEIALKFEANLCKELTGIKSAPLGFNNLIGDLAEQSDVRVYKMKQRLLEG